MGKKNNLLLIFFLIIGAYSYAQTPPPPGFKPFSDGPGESDYPIDSWIFILMTIAVLFIFYIVKYGKNKLKFDLN